MACGTTARRSATLAREVFEQLYGEWADGSFFGPEGLDNLRAMVEQAGGVDRLAAHDVRLGDDGLMFVGSPATPHRRWRTLIDALSADEVRSRKTLRARGSR
jgi:hypothetical protein